MYQQLEIRELSLREIGIGNKYDSGLKGLNYMSYLKW